MPIRVFAKQLMGPAKIYGLATYSKCIRELTMIEGTSVIYLHVVPHQAVKYIFYPENEKRSFR